MGSYDNNKTINSFINHQKCFKSIPSLSIPSPILVLDVPLLKDFLVIQSVDQIRGEKWEGESMGMGMEFRISGRRCGACRGVRTAGQSTGAATLPLPCSAFSSFASPLP